MEQERPLTNVSKQLQWRLDSRLDLVDVAMQMDRQWRNRRGGPVGAV